MAKKVKNLLLTGRKLNKFLNDIGLGKEPVKMEMAPKIESIIRRRRVEKGLKLNKRMV